MSLERIPNGLTLQTLQTFLDLLPDAAILVDHKGQIAYATQQAEMMFGYGSGELMNQPVEVLMPEPFRLRHVEYRQQYIRHPTIRRMGQRSVELWGQRKNGSKFPVDITLSPIFFKDKRTDFLVLALIRDLTPMIKEQKERLRAIAETSRDAIVAADQEGRVTYWNPTAEIMFGYTKEEMKGQPLTRIIPERFRDAHIAGVQRFVTTGQSRIIGRTIEVTGLRKDGTEFPVELSLAAWKSEGQWTFAAIIRDVTERKRIEQFKEDFIYIVPHELRTPLTVLKEGAEMFRTGLLGHLTPEQEEFFDTMMRAVHRLIRIAEKIEVVEQIMLNRLPYTFTEVNMTDIVDQLEMIHRPAAEEKSIHLQVERPVSVVSFQADRKWLSMAFDQLVENTIQATPKGGTVTVRLVLLPSVIRIEVEDMGPGIPPEEISTIFDRLRSVGSLHERKTGGIGVGLYIAQSVIHRHRGTIAATNRTEGGVRMTVEFPRQVAG